MPAATLPCSTSPTGDQHAAPALTWAAAAMIALTVRRQRPQSAPAPHASATSLEVLAPPGDDVGDDVPGGAGAQTHEHQRVYPSCGSATPVAVRIIPGETGADMCRNLSECVRIYGYETEYPDHLVTVL